MIIPLLSALKKILFQLDDQITLWDALKNHIDQYISAIISCLERSNTNLPASVMQMNDVQLLLKLNQTKTLQTLYNPVQTTLIKLKKVENKISSIFQASQNEIIHFIKKSNLDEDTIILDIDISNYIEIFSNAKRIYSQEFV